MSEHAPQGLAESDGMYPLPLDTVEAGWLADCDVYVGSTLLLAKGASLSRGMLDALQMRGVETLLVRNDSQLVEKARSSAAQHKPLAKLLSSVALVYEQNDVRLAVPKEFIDSATQEIERAFHDLETGKKFDAAPMRQIVHQLIDLFGEHPKGAVKLLDLDRYDAYTYRHSLNVSMFFMTLAMALPYTEAELADLVLGALLHDIGKMRVGVEILNKPGKLTDEEFARIKKHPEWGLEILADENLSPAARQIVRHHHERLDGRGYPDGLKGDEVGVNARLSAVCDVYDALTTVRSYKQKMNFSAAVDILVQGSGTQFDPAFVHLFIRRVGRYPVGTFVTLSSGETAVVVEIRESAPGRPVVALLLDAAGEMLPIGNHLDLSQEPGITITGVVAHSATGRSAAGG